MTANIIIGALIAIVILWYAIDVIKGLSILFYIFKEYYR